MCCDYMIVVGSCGCCHFKISESGVRTIVKKKQKRKGNSWSQPYSYTSRYKNLAIFCKMLYLILKMQLLCACRIAVRMVYPETSINWEKVMPFYDSWKQKESEKSKGGELNASKGWFDHFTKRFGFGKSQDNRRSSFCWPWGKTDKFPPTIKKIIEDKHYLPEHFFKVEESTLFWKKTCHKGCIFVRKKREYQELRHERIG